MNRKVLFISRKTILGTAVAFVLVLIYAVMIGLSTRYGNLRNISEEAGVILHETLRLYLGTEDPAVLEDYLNRAKVVGYARLLRRTIRREPDNQALITHCREQLTELLSKVDNITYELLPIEE